MVRRQIATVLADIGLDGITIGVLATPALVRVVADALDLLDAADECPSS